MLSRAKRTEVCSARGDLTKKPAGREQQERTRAPLLHDCHNSERFPAAPADGRGARRQHGHQHDGAGDAFPRVLFFRGVSRCGPWYAGQAGAGSVAHDVAHPQADCLQVVWPSRILLCSRAAAGVPPRGAEQQLARHERRSAVLKAWGFSVAVAGRCPIACLCIV